jgi:CRP/FNR family cyclic AMP-dependent transcriptional regulator
MNVDLTATRALLCTNHLFGVLEPADLDALLSRAIVRRIARNELVVRRGDPGAGPIIILSGRVRISVTSETGKEVTFAVLGPGEVLGEMSLLDGADRCADATAVEGCVVLVIDRGRFMRLLRSNPDASLRLAAALCRRLRESNTAFEDKTSLNLASRLAKTLLRLAQDHGTASARGIRIGVKLSQSDLSSLVGATRAKVNRQLRQWEEAGVLQKEGRCLVISQPDALASS